MLALLLIVGTAIGCGDDSPSTADAGEGNARLVILDPPGDTVGIKYNDAITLRILYENREGQATAGVPIEFELVATSEREDTAGSTLSTNQAVTDSLGVARVDLVVGAQEATFRVAVDAPDAPTAFFHINISEGGFVRLFITPIHEGWRSVESIARVQVRLYRADALTCAAANIDELPMSLAPPRSLSEFGPAVSYLNVNAGQPHAVVAWSEVSDQDNATPAGIGCVDLGGSQLPNGEISLDLVVADRDLVLGPVEVTSRFDLAAVAAALAQRGAERPWQSLACPAGPGQLLLDCALDAAAPDGDLDCVVNGSSAIADAIAAQRGAPDGSGCRPVTLPSNAPSLDRAITDAVIAGGSFPSGTGLDAMLATRSSLVTDMALSSQLTALSSTAGRHRLLAAIAGADPQVHTVDLGATGRPVIEQRSVAMTVDGNQVGAGAHGFTLRYGSIAADAFTQLTLAPAGLDPQALGMALAGSVTDGSSGQSGCSGLSAIACRSIGQAETCVAAACAQGAGALDVVMTRWSRSMDGPGLDFELQSGTGLAYDSDGDLVVDALGAAGDPETPGAWSAALILSDGTSIPITGAF